jgi:subtilisin family serine protease
MPRFLLQFEPTTASQVLQELQALAIPLVFPKPLFDYLVVDVPALMTAQLQSLPGVLKVEADKRMGVLPFPVNQELQRVLTGGPLGLPNPLNLVGAMGVRPDTWPTGESRKIVGADVADADGITGTGVKVAVLDTGTDPSHPQLLGNTGESTIKTQPLAFDENGHGVHTATTIAGASFSHPQGILQGVAPRAQLIIIKVLGAGIGLGDWSDILAGMQRAADLGAKIISMSLGGDDTDDPESSEFRVVRQLTEQGIICCIAAGNSGSAAQTIGSPGSAPDALTIGAINKAGQIADFSSRGSTLLGLTKPDAVAPGVDILSGSTGIIAAYRFLDGAGRFAAISGTSMACPHASGVLALGEELARQRGGTLTTAAVKYALATYYDRDPDNTEGYGLITYPILKQHINEGF